MIEGWLFINEHISCPHQPEQLFSAQLFSKI